ncbi:MAG TPA: hypothetical protein VKG85_10645 [Actinomycetes bacterium]|nr:hypothetical protein [Actinomycetes bacterium]
MTPTQIVKRAKQAMTEATSVRLRGEAVKDGDRYLIDLRFQAGVGARGVVVKNGMDMEILRIRRTVYLRASADTWLELVKDEQAAEVVGRLADKFVKISLTDRDLRDPLRFTDLKRLTAEIFKDMSPPSAVTKSDVHSVNGSWALGLTDSSGGVVEFAAVGPTYVLRGTTGPAADDEVTFDFLEWDVPVKLSRPPASQVVDPANLPPA